MTIQTPDAPDAARPLDAVAFALPNVRLIGGLVLLALIAMFALLHNPFWVRGGDSEVYLSLARSLVQGHGLRFNAQPVGLVPPGWPLLLAGMMKLCPVFAVLKLELLLIAASGLWLYFFVLQHLVTLRLAVGTTLLSALLPAEYRLTYEFLTEGMFCVIAGAAALLALDINRRNAGPVRIALLAGLCFVALATRWTMMLFWPIVAGLLLRGELWPRWNARWFATVVTGAVTLVCFVGLRHYLRVDSKLLDPRFDASLSTEYAVVTGTAQDDTLASRLRDTDRWIFSLFWGPFGPNAGARPINRVASVTLLIFFTLGAILSVRQREWVWLAVLLYYGMLCVNWPQPIARYLVPVTPLLIAGCFRGFTLAFIKLPPTPAVWTSRIFIAAMALGILVPNFLAFARDTCDMQDRDFYRRYQSGTDQSLTQAARLINDWQLHSGDVVISRSRGMFAKNNFTNSWMRGMHFLCDIAIRNLPDELGPEPDEAVAQWMGENHVSIYLYQATPASDEKLHWTFWRDSTAKRLDTEWHMYRLRKGKFVRIRLKDDHQIWPASVPGL